MPATTNSRSVLHYPMNLIPFIPLCNFINDIQLCVGNPWAPTTMNIFNGASSSGSSIQFQLTRSLRELMNITQTRNETMDQIWQSLCRKGDRSQANVRHSVVMRDIQFGDEIVLSNDIDCNTQHNYDRHGSTEAQSSIRLPNSTCHDFSEKVETAEAPNGYQCDRCGKMFTYASYREKHLKYTRCMDKGDRKFRCLLCPRSFEKRDRLRIHVLHVHENHRPHVCTICGKSFSQSSSLNKHSRVHSGEKPYKCTHCDRSFTASSILRTHVRQHSGEKPFQCTLCGKSFASHAAHDSHVRRTHSTQTLHHFKCTVCEKTFEHQQHLNFHQQCIHPVVS